MDQHISERGEVTYTPVTLYGRKFCLTKIRQKHLKRMEELGALRPNGSTKRFMTTWHDHSDVLGHSYYLITVWFMYDTETYLTAEEYG